MPLSPQDTFFVYLDGAVLVLEFLGPVIIVIVIIGGIIWALSGKPPERERHSVREEPPPKREPEERTEREGEWPPAPRKRGHK